MKIYKKIFLSLILLGVIFFATLLPRLYKIDNSITDWHSFRQADTAMVARNFADEGFNILHPRTDNILAISDSKKPNPQGLTFLEFPIYTLIVGFVWDIFGVYESSARLVSAIFASFSAVFLFLLVRKFSNSRVAIIASLVFALMPYSIYYGRVIMPNSTMVCLGLASLWLFSRYYFNNSKISFFLSSVLFALASLSYPYVVFWLIPIIYLALIKDGLFYYSLKYYGFLLMSFIPLVLWRAWGANYPEAQIGSNWYLNYGDIRFSGAFFRWLIFERLAKLILGTGGFVLMFFGLIARRQNKENYFYFVWLFSMILYFVIFASSNVRHDYYQYIYMPVLAVFVALGIDHLLKAGQSLVEKSISVSVAVFLIIISIAFGYFEVKGYYLTNNDIVEAGKKADELLSANDKVIAPLAGDLSLLYYVNRPGWAEFYEEMSVFKDQGATAVVSLKFDEGIEKLAKENKVLYRTNKYIIISLNK